MATKRAKQSRTSTEELISIELEGFKSFRDRTRVEIRPLTLLAGANSAGKSSLMQPLLLMKQTLEASHDPGALELGGPCVRFTSAEQMHWKGLGEKAVPEWRVALRTRTRSGDSELGVHELDVTYGATDLGTQALATSYCGPIWADGSADFSFSVANDVAAIGSASKKTLRDRFAARSAGRDVEVQVVRTRIAHGLRLLLAETLGQNQRTLDELDPMPLMLPESLIHLPGLRGNPRRVYPLARVDRGFAGPFPPYAASALMSWQRSAQDGDVDARGRLEGVWSDLQSLGLTSTAHAVKRDDTAVEVFVGRLPQSEPGGEEDLVSIADVGVGASQVLPVVVALRAARPGQVVHVEQPELHLHPRAQVAMAEILAEAALRGVRVIVETHSSVLLTTVQTLVARHDHDLSLQDVALHWFSRDEAGATKVETAELQEDGSYGNWPVDFTDVEMDAEGAFLEAAFKRSEGGA